MTFCACLGPKNGEPLCRCKMRAARAYIRTNDDYDPIYHTRKIGPTMEQMTLRDQLAAAALVAIYQTQTMLTDRAADLAYEQADEMIRARQQPGLNNRSE